MTNSDVLKFNPTRLILEPKVHVVGQTAWNYEELLDWVWHNRLDEVSGDSSTPLCKLLDQTAKSNLPNGPEYMVEFGGRFCYRSWKKGRSTEEYLKNIIESKHNSVLRHMVFNVVVEGVSRSLSHELVRHAAGVAPSQESQRYVDAKDMKFVVPPLLLKSIKTKSRAQQMKDLEHFWKNECVPGLRAYMARQEEYTKFINETIKVDEKSLIKKRANEAARASLPNCAETRLLFSLNGDALRHILTMRGDKHADLEIRRFACVLYEEIRHRAPFTLYDFKEGEDSFGPILER